MCPVLADFNPKRLSFVHRQNLAKVSRNVHGPVIRGGFPLTHKINFPATFSHSNFSADIIPIIPAV